MEADAASGVATQHAGGRGRSGPPRGQALRSIPTRRGAYPAAFRACPIRGCHRAEALMQGSILKLFMPFTQNGVLFGVYDYLLPIMLYCAWSTLAFLDLAREGNANPSRTRSWSAAILLLPVAGA